MGTLGGEAQPVNWAAEAGRSAATRDTGWNLIASRIDYFCYNAPGAIPLIEGKLAKGIAILTRDRSPVGALRVPSHASRCAQRGEQRAARARGSLFP